MRKFIAADPDRCTGCRICEMVCSAVKEGGFNPSLSRIQTVWVAPYLVTSLACRLCEDPPCVRSCPEGALTVDSETGVIVVDEGCCIGCGLCVKACEFDAMRLHPERKVVIVCDLCGGEPKCVEFCPKDALGLRTAEEVAQRNEMFGKLLPQA